MAGVYHDGISPEEMVEQCALGCFLLDLRGSMLATGGIDARAFANPANKTIAKAVIEMHRDNLEAADIVILANKLSQHGQLETVGGIDYLMYLQMAPTSARSVMSYWRQVVAHWRLRALAYFGSNLSKVRETSTSNEDIAKILREIREIDAITHPGAPVARPFDPDEKLDLQGVPTGIEKIDSCLDHGGFPAGRVSVIAGATGKGKSTFSLQCVYNLLDDPFSERAKRVAYISGEMADHELRRKLHRMRCGYSKRPGGKQASLIEDGGSPVEQWEAATKWVNECDLVVQDLDRQRGGIRELGRSLSWLASQHRVNPVEICVLDYFQLFHLAGFRGARHEEVGAMSAELCDIAGELNIPIVAISQVTMNAVGGYQTRDGRQLEDDASLIIDVRRKRVKKDKEWSEDPATTIVHLRKVRFGSGGREIQATFDHRRRMLDFDVSEE